MKGKSVQREPQEAGPHPAGEARRQAAQDRGQDDADADDPSDRTLNEHPRGRSEVACTLVLAVTTPATIVVQVAAAQRDGTNTTEHLAVTDNSHVVQVERLPAPVGGRQHLLDLRPGTVNLSYQATITAAGAADRTVTPMDRVQALRPSRYSPSDRLVGFASARFGDLPAGLPRVHAICDYVWRHVQYVAETSDSTTDAVDTLLAGRGVCRDFAHLVAALCRAVEVPARIASVYAPGLSPMDFHAVVETDIDGHWRVWDATRSAPRQAMVRIATGRDAADTAFISVLGGRVELSSIEIVAITDGALPGDDHNQLVALG